MTDKKSSSLFPILSFFYAGGENQVVAVTQNKSSFENKYPLRSPLLDIIKNKKIPGNYKVSIQ